jgi:hypothetical protein
MSEEIIQGKQSSIDVSKNAKGEFSFGAKIYFDDDKTDPKVVIDKLRSIYNELQDRFKSGN